MLNRVAFALLVAFACEALAMPAEDLGFPAPFERVLSLKEPPIEGKQL